MINTILTPIFLYNPKDWLFLLTLFILAAITVHTIPGVEVYYTVSPIAEDRMRYLHFVRIRMKECQPIF